VTIYRTLAKANPDAYLPDLAWALENLGVRLAQAGHHENVAEVQEELARVLERDGRRRAL
jgi:hypothetical protein